MWQQLDCNAAYATTGIPAAAADLLPWVETTIGAGSNGNAQPAGFNDTSTGEGSTAMGFYNVLKGDAPYPKYLADHYAMSDNYHQAVNGRNRGQPRDAGAGRCDLVQRWQRQSGGSSA